MEQEDSRLIFEIEGVPRKAGLLKKHRSYIAVYEDYIHIELDGDTDEYTRDEVFDIYVKEPVVEDVDSRETVVEFYEEGDHNYYELEDGTFPGLAEKMLRLVESEWAYLKKKRDYPPTVRWFVACGAVVAISSENNPHIFGGAYKEPDYVSGRRETLYESWGIKSQRDLLEMLPKLLAGRAVAEYLKKAQDPAGLDEDERELFAAIAREGGERCLWAWDLQRLIWLASLGFVANWLSAAEAMDWCLQAARKLQNYFQNWDEFMRGYLLGYCYWSGESLDDESSEAHTRRQIYEHYKTLPVHPWQIAWRQPLTKEW